MTSNDELQEWYAQRDQLNQALDQDPENEDLLAMKAELDAQITELEAAAVVAAPKASTPPPADAPKWDKSKHPAFQKLQASEEAAQITIKQNDVVLARWPKDRQFYEARVTSITGSSADPVYYVKYLKYDDHASVRRQDIKPLANPAKKRKAEDAATTPVAANTNVSAPSTSANSNIISAPPIVDPALAAKAKLATNQDGDAGSRPNKAMRQMPKSKALNTSKQSWQSFQKKQGGKKDSMFRTQEGNPNARVGFTGSGHEMRKDETRKRHQYNRDDFEDA